MLAAEQMEGQVHAIRRCTDGSVKLLGDEVIDSCHSYSEMDREEIVPEGRAEATNAYIASIVIYHLTVVPYPSCRLIR